MTDVKEEKKGKEQNYRVEREYSGQVPFEEIVARICRFHMEKQKYRGS